MPASRQKAWLPFENRNSLDGSSVQWVRRWSSSGFDCCSRANRTTKFSSRTVRSGRTPPRSYPLSSAPGAQTRRKEAFLSPISSQMLNHPFLPLGRKPVIEQITAIENFLHQIERHIVIMVGGFKANA